MRYWFMLHATRCTTRTSCMHGFGRLYDGRKPHARIVKLYNTRLEKKIIHMHKLSTARMKEGMPNQENPRKPQSFLEKKKIPWHFPPSASATPVPYFSIHQSARRRQQHTTPLNTHPSFPYAIYSQLPQSLNHPTTNHPTSISHTAPPLLPPPQRSTNSATKRRNSPT